jgi:AcrR family transcriptional regulator
MDEQWQDQQCPTTRHAPVNRIRRGMTRTAIHAAVATPGRASSRSRWSCSPSRGYEKTSLREIAGRLDVTKAALYYHFKFKEDIARSLVEDYFGQIDALITWARTQPRTAPTRREIMCRYLAIVAEGSEAFRMLRQNQAAVNGLAAAKGRGELFRERMSALIEQLTEPGASADDRLRAAMALGGVSVGWMFFADQVDDRSKLSAAVLAIACDLAGTSPGPSHASLVGLA